MSSNPLSIIELMEKEYDVTIKGDDSAGKRCFNGLFEIEDDNKVNIEKIKSIKGIGLKTAQRLIIELKDKILNIQISDEFKPIKNNTIKEETLSALDVLGYSMKQSEKLVDNIIQSQPSISTEEIIRLALNKL